MSIDFVFFLLLIKDEYVQREGRRQLIERPYGLRARPLAASLPPRGFRRLSPLIAGRLCVSAVRSGGTRRPLPPP